MLIVAGCSTGKLEFGEDVNVLIAPAAVKNWNAWSGLISEIEVSSTGRSLQL
jgi:hypothetical protein